jgi:hypothetical protein|tara:strand:+ start:718 stop:1773 length:1056 start_codon:yes stop_codon:yes gene_type:complete
MIIKKLIKKNPFMFNETDKYKIFKNYINFLTKHHYKNCIEYKKIIKNINFQINEKNELEDYPMLPVRLFKEFILKSIPTKRIFKKLISSGTSGGEPSKIYLDKLNSNNQIKVLNNIMKTLLGNERIPMLIIDKNPQLNNNQNINARMAAINGFSIFGKNHCYVLDDSGKIDKKKITLFLSKYGLSSFFIFGFTSIIYESLILNNKKKYDLKNGILLHGGGWKKLEKIKINNDLYKQKLYEKCNLKNIFNYYGMIEQTGSIFIECKCGYFITSIFSKIFIRDKNFNILKANKKGLVQLISLLPTSYPGHNILTEDIGEIIDRDKCKCNYEGTRFLIHGRAKKAEIRGCSDAR